MQASSVIPISFHEFSSGSERQSVTEALPDLECEHLMQHPLSIRDWAIQLQEADPNDIASSGFDLVVIDYSRDGSREGEYSKKDIEAMKSAGITPIAYLSVGEAEDYRFYWRREWFIDKPEWLGKENPDWEGNYAVKYWEEEWREILRAYVDRIVDQGFLGLYLDKVDEFEYWSDPSNGENLYLPESEAAEKMIDLIKEIAEYARAKAGECFLIIPQNGERILKYDSGELLEIVSGWAAEDLFYDGTEKWGEEDAAWISSHRLPYLDLVISEGKPVLSVDYVDDGSGYADANKRRIDDYRRRALERGYLPYAARSDRELDSLNLIECVQPSKSFPFKFQVGSNVDAEIVRRIYKYPKFEEKGKVVVGGPLSNPEARVPYVHFTRDELRLHGRTYRSVWAKLDYGLIIKYAGRVYLMGTHRFGTEAALIYFKENPCVSFALVKWVDLNLNAKVEAEEVQLLERS